MPLMTVSTTIITVLHSAEVVHIPQESRSSLIAGYPLYNEYPYTLLGCVLGHHYKVVQWFSLVCSVPAEVSPEVSVQITKVPLLHRVVLRRVHSLTHSLTTRWIPSESTQSAPPIGTPNLVLPYTTPSRTHIGS
jgi:hypothetical protein